MIPNVVTIASRKSPLALWQSTHVQQQLQALHPSLIIEIKGMLTQGDKQLATPLYDIGGKALFVKELQKAILERRADLAVHSIKDMPVMLPDGLCLGVICQREDPRDAFVSNHYRSLEALPDNATVGTSSLRRQCQLKTLRPDLNVVPLRGNVGTRLAKLDDGQFDAIILAAAGLKRLGLESRIAHAFAPSQMLPGAGQGAIGIECRRDDEALISCLTPLDHGPTRQCIIAERRITEALGGSCQVPIGAYATIENNQMTLNAMVGKIDGSQTLSAHHSGPLDSATHIADSVAQSLIEQGAKAIVELYQ